MKAIFKRFRKNEDGATAIEYGLIAALVSIMIIGGLTALGTNLGDLFQRLAELMAGTATPPAGG
ncbi:Flp family type IVb pilin [Ochrobactrum sp. GRS2]|nr:Flp family type IVb pilin [Ochrobactrum sp. GRS2]